MAKNDIRPSRPGSGGTQHIVAYPLDAGQTFEEGEVVVVAASGELAEAGDDPTVVAGISAASSQGKNTNGTLRGTRDTGTLIQVYTPTDEQTFITENFATDGAGTSATPTLANVGDQAGFTLASGTWSVDTGASNLHVEIIEVLDRDGKVLGNINDDPGTGQYVRFVFI